MIKTLLAPSYPSPETWLATVSDLPPGATTVTATSGVESANVVVQGAPAGIPVKDRSGATLTVRDRSGAAVAVKARE